jgi:flagellar basal body-associated protein FliL
MFNLLTPLKVLLNPPTVVQGLPKERVLLHVSLINQGQQGAVIDVFLDPAAQPLCQWCTSPKHQIALDPQQACEVSFTFEIPLGALPGIYPCTVVVDAPDHYPEETPLHYPCKLEVLAAEQPVERLETPTFSLSPVTSPNKPLLIEANKTHKLSITVNNHSTRVDRFRLACPDLDERWYTVQYLSTDLVEMGLVTQADGLELNPGSQGEILMQLHYPSDMPAGLYSPTVQLLSDNTPEQMYLDLVYLEVKPEYCLEADLETILGKARHGPGRYRLKLKNDSNLIRELAIGARGRDEVEWCRYDCEPDAVKMLIGDTAEVSLTVHPLQKWRRPFIGFGRELPFQVDITDRQSLPLPDPLPTGLFVWKARPWWHFILMLLAGVGVLSGIGLLIWFFFFKPSPPPALTDYKPDSATYTEGDRIRLNWTIANADQLTQLRLTLSRNQTASTPQVYDLRKGIPAALSQYCQLRDRTLSCANVNTGARLAGKYIFQLQLTAKSAKQSIQQDLNVDIKPKPLPQVVKLGSRQSMISTTSCRLPWQNTVNPPLTKH